MDKIDELLTRGVEKVYPDSQSLEKRIQTGKLLRVYIGVDPTGTRLHIGHSIGLTKLQQFADAGHEAILLFGTGTVLVGDPSQRMEERKRITQEEIEENIKTWKEQVSSIIDFEKVKVKQNADWLLSLKLTDIINIMSNISSVQLFKRDNFQKRIDRGDTVWAHETLYPLLQGYDSVAMDVDVEIGGTDQTFNMLIGRELMQKMKHKEKYVLTVPMILGTDGKQMSKSTGNCVWLNDTPEDMFGKIMSIPDGQIESYAELLTSLPIDELTKLEPINQKKKLALAIVARFHDQEQAKRAQAHFEKTVQKKEVPEDAELFRPTKPTLTSLTTVIEAGYASSNSEAKRLIKQGGFYLNNERIDQPDRLLELKQGDILKKGTHHFKKVTL